MSNLSVKIKSGERVALFGKTQSGKTTLAKYLLLPLHRLVVIDLKLGLAEWGLEDFATKHLRAIKNQDDYKIRVTTKEESLSVMSQLYESGNGTIFIDEIVALVPEQTKAPQIITDIWQRGAFKKISGWAGSQRPKKVPLIFLSEAEHFFIFKLNLEADRKTVYDNTGSKVLLKPTPDKHGFYYYSLESGKTRYYSQLNI
jgi:hypothetical protein